jgi:SAM-dependent methyltransferase
MENSFDIRASTWDENPRRIKLVEDISEIIIRDMPLFKTSRILDYGCGTGLLGYKLIDHVEEVTFCDTSDGMLEQVRQKQAVFGYRNVTIVKADLLQEPIPGKFDFIFSMLVLHHVDNIVELTKRFSNLLIPGGVFCWIDLDKEDGSFHGDDIIPHFGFQREESEKILLNSGLDTFFYTSELFIEKEINGGLKQFPLFILAARKI